jgi:hypothetical protein
VAGGSNDLNRELVPKIMVLIVPLPRLNQHYFRLSGSEIETCEMVLVLIMIAMAYLVSTGNDIP